MKVVHICAEIAPGGAAHSTLNLHHGLLDLGIDSWILTGSSKGSIKNCVVLPKVTPEQESNKCLVEDLVWGNRTQISNTHFSLDLSGRSVVNHPLIVDADVVNLHWVADFLSSSTVAEFASLRKPVVWTLHDMRPLTGGCHFSAGCLRFQEECGDCPQLQFDCLDLTRHSLQAMGAALVLLRPHFVAPSRWMHDNALTSRVSRDLKSSCIPYGVDTELFRSGSTMETRRKLGLCEDTDYILLASHSLLEKRKGAEYALRILELLGSDPRIKERIAAGQVRLLCCGNTTEEFRPEGWLVERTGYVLPREMPSVYQAASLMLFTSTEDNLPNVILEAMACGLPVVGHAVGGAKDLLGGEYESDCLFELGHSAQGAELLLRLLGDPGKRKIISASLLAKARKNCTLSAQARSYQELYCELLKAPSQFILEPVPNSLAEKDFFFDACLVVETLSRENKVCRESVEPLHARIESLQKEIEFLQEIQRAYHIVMKSKWVRLGEKLQLCKPAEERFLI